ncbi:hypothetical protein Syun_025340 [Stephania yunnanensis]|uniref:Uncharacterized protein n=1 Tax=Stephania yunnanensis TaxID=152371 RepID=A0AAP0HW48_9MAGN
MGKMRRREYNRLCGERNLLEFLKIKVKLMFGSIDLTWSKLEENTIESLRNRGGTHA